MKLTNRQYLNDIKLVPAMKSPSATGFSSAQVVFAHVYHSNVVLGALVGAKLRRWTPFDGHGGLEDSFGIPS